MTKQEKLAFLELYPDACEKGIEAFMAWEGSLESYFLEHLRGADAYRWCLFNGAVGLPDIATEIGGSVSVREGATATFALLIKVGMNVDVLEGATTHFPALVYIGGDVCVEEGATLTLKRGCVIKGKVIGKINWVD